MKESRTPVQRGTGKQAELQAENIREFQEEEFEKQKCDYKERRVMGIRQREMETWAVFGGKNIGGERRGQSPRHSASSEQSPFSTALSV